MESRSFWLRRQRTTLWFLIGFETLTAACVLLMRFALWYDRTFYRDQDWFEFYERSGPWHRMLPNLTSDHTVLPTMFLLFPLACIALLAALIVFQIRNRKNPVAGWWSAGALLLCIVIPLITWLVYSGMIHAYHKNVELAMEWWLCLGIPIAHIFLFDLLRRYTKVIRIQQTQESLQKGDSTRLPAGKKTHIPRLKKERAILTAMTVIEIYCAGKVLLMQAMTWYWNNLSQPVQKQITEGAWESFWNRTILVWSSEGSNTFYTMYFYPFVCLAFLAVLSIFLCSNRKESVTSRQSPGMLLFCILLPIWLRFLYLWLSSSMSGINFHPAVEMLLSVWLCVGILVAHLFLFRDLRRYTKAIRAQEQKESTESSEAQIFH